jgi:hypothetical protein
VSADGLSLSVRLFNISDAAWASDAIVISNTNPTLVEAELALSGESKIYRLELSLSGGLGAASELGFVGSALITR